MLKKSLDEVETGAELASNIRIYSDKPDVQYRVRIDKGTALTDKHIKRLKREGVQHVFIRDPDLDDLDPFIHDEDVDQTEKELTIQLQDFGKDIESGAEEHDIDTNQLRDTLHDFLDAIKNSEAMMAFTSLKSHNDYTAKHSIDVTKLALHLYITNEETLQDKLMSETGASPAYIHKYMDEDLGLGAMLHDLGKWTIPTEVLNKPSELDDQEWEVMKQHPVEGREILKKQEENIRAPALMPAYLHHEKYGGGGYPRGLEGEQIHLYGRLTALCDVYSALTSERPYRVGKTPNRARNIMHSMQEEDDHFDPELFDLFMEAIPPFPIGQEVVLSNGTKGVVSNLNGNPETPTVRVLYEGKDRIDEPYEITVNTDSSPDIIN